MMWKVLLVASLAMFLLVTSAQASAIRPGMKTKWVKMHPIREYKLPTVYSAPR
jgi:hypothetical protein